MKKFDGKKLLLLGSNVGTLDLIRYARANGAYTIVADNLPVEKSIGKHFSDDNVLISTGDIDHLKDYIMTQKVDGIFAGISEFNLLNAMRLCEDFGLPFYCTRKQWDSIEDKEQFRRLCEANGAPVPTTFFCGSYLSEEELKKINYPVVLKPVDSSASKGVCICRDEKKLLESIPDAIKHSGKGRFIIEEFFEGEEFTAHYAIVKGMPFLACVDNRVPVAVHHGDVTTIPIARIYPSSFVEEYIRQVNEKMMDLCHTLGMEYGVLFVQGLYNKKKNRFVIFEAGLRCAGEAPYRILEKTNGVNFMDGFVDYALTGDVDSIQYDKYDPYINGKSACVVSFVSKGGKVGKIVGFDDIEKEVVSIVDKECRYHVGDNTPIGDTLRQIMLRFVLVCDSKEQMIDDVETINQKVKVLDDKGSNLCLTFDIRDFYNFFK